MTEEKQIAVLAEAGLNELKQLKRVLTRAGVESAIIRSPYSGGG